jgi:hypothetical protein
MRADGTSALRRAKREKNIGLAYENKICTYAGIEGAT